MDADRVKQAREFFDVAIERSKGDRRVYLERVTSNDPALRAEVLSLLEAYEKAGSFLESIAEQDKDSPDISKLSLPTIAHYRVVRLLDEGGMGAVFEAEQEHPHRRVAIKVIRRGRLTDRRALRLFEREIQTLARLEHPGIASIHEATHTSEGEPCFVMELVPV